MGLYGDLKRRLKIDSTEDEIFYNQVVEELERGYRRAGLWAKSLAETDGNIEAAEAKYVRLRVLSLKEELFASSFLAADKAPKKTETDPNASFWPDTAKWSDLGLYAVVGGVAGLIAAILAILAAIVAPPKESFSDYLIGVASAIPSSIAIFLFFGFIVVALNKLKKFLLE